MDIEAVKTSYARWAPVYDTTFGQATKAGRKHAVEYINSRMKHGPYARSQFNDAFGARYKRADKNEKEDDR